MNSKSLPKKTQQSSPKKFPNYDQFRASSQHQVFSIPDSIIFYMAKNPSSIEIYKEMIKTCKYFFIKNPIIFFHCLNYSENDGWKTCFNESCIGSNKKCCKMNIEKMKSKICVTFELLISSSTSSNIASSLIPKLYQSDVFFLELENQNISFNDLLFFSKELRRCILTECTVLYQNGKEVPCEKLFANSPFLACFGITFRQNGTNNFSKTVTEFLKIPYFKNLSAYHICGINKTFDMDKFFEYLKKNTSTLAFIEYDDVPLSDPYKMKLQVITDEFLDSEIPKKYKPAYIDFPGQLRHDKLYELYEMQYKCM